MSKAPFFISPPRTRSTVLFQLAGFYATSGLGLQGLYENGSFELFIEFNPNIHMTDVRTNMTQLGEIYPVAGGDGLSVHYMSPARFTTTHQRNLYKLEQLRLARERGYEYYIKGTYHITDSVPEVLDFFSDRHFVITRRRNTLDYVLSYVYARESNLYNLFQTEVFDNTERYQRALQEGVSVSKDTIASIDELLNKTKAVYQLPVQLETQGLEYTVVDYEDMENYQQLFDVCDRIYSSTAWREWVPDDFRQRIPVKVDKDYSQCIHNYNTVVDIVQRKIEDSGINELFKT